MSRQGTVKSVVVFAPNLVGDTVMATPTFRAVREGFPDARVTLLIKRSIASVLDGAPWFDDVILYAAGGRARGLGMIEAVRALRCARAELAILLPNSTRSALMAWLGGIPRRVGYDRGDRGVWLTDRLLPEREGGKFRPTPILDSYLELARRVGCTKICKDVQLFTTRDDELAADGAWDRLGLGAGRPVVCLNTGGAFGPAKNWPVPYFAALARRLVMEMQVQVLVLCGPAELENARAIVGEAGVTGVVSLAEEALGLGLTKACVRRASLMVTTDSGPRHFAGAFGVPVITLYGPTHMEWTRTNYANAVDLSVPVPCGPCQQPVCGEGHHRCMREILPSMVYRAARGLLEARRNLVA